MPRSKKHTNKNKRKAAGLKISLDQLNTLMEPNPVGRPSKITEEILQRLQIAFLAGATDEEACAFVGISPKTLYTYQDQYPEFTQQKEAWKKNPILRAKFTVVTNLDRVGNAQWYLERRSKAEFGKEEDASSKQQINFFIGSDEANARLAQALGEFITGGEKEEDQ